MYDWEPITLGISRQVLAFYKTSYSTEYPRSTPEGLHGACGDRSTEKREQAVTSSTLQFYLAATLISASHFSSPKCS